MGWFKRKPSKPSPPQEYRGIPTVKFDASRVTENVRVEVRRCVDKIEGLERVDFDQVHGAALKCVSVGGDLHVFCVALLEAPIAGMTKRKAADIAHHMMRRVRSIMDREHLQKLGIQYSEWLYSGAPCDPRSAASTPEEMQQDAAHKAVNGKRYETQKGLLVNGKWTWPGWENECRCVSKAVILGFD